MVAVEASPYKSAAEELAALRKSFRLACRCYLERVEMEIIRIHEQVVTAGMVAAANDGKGRLTAATAAGAGRGKASTSGAANGAKSPNGQTAPLPATRGAATARDGNSEIHDLRDMLTLLRTLQIKPEAGRRKDLKKIEGLVEELRLLSERWDKAAR